MEWVEKAEQLLLAGVNYFQVVFTLPKELSRLALGNRRTLYSLLFRAAWQALEATVRDEQGYEPAAALVLHTWNQRLDAHAHVHAVVPGGGPSLLDRTKWKKTEFRGVPTCNYLVDAKQLRRHYRDFFLAGLDRLHRQGELKLGGDFIELQDTSNWNELIRKLNSAQWVAYIEPPPSENCKPEHVVRYLGRYLTGGPISDRRLIRADEHEVVFWAREGTEVGGSSRRVPIRLSPEEFLRRWCLHILPKGYVKTRRYGGWSNRNRADYLARCQSLLSEESPLRHASPSHTPPPGAIQQEEATSAETSAEPTSPQCPRCGANMQLLLTAPKPSWSTMRSRGLWPQWYQHRTVYQDSG